jgi:uncharacterized delta-60 repeat protein
MKRSFFSRTTLCVAFCIVTLSLASLFARAASMLDPTFNIGTGANYYVEQMLEQPDGRILICGLFDHYNGESLPFIGRLNPDGSIDTSFHAEATYWVRHMLLQADGKIIIGGMFNMIGSASRNLIARLNRDGSLDPSFNPGRGGEVSIGTSIYDDPRTFIIWMDFQPDGKILATGNFHNYDGVSSSGIVRINPDGSRDATFKVGAGIETWGRFVKVQDNSQIILSGWFNTYNNHTFNRLVRLNSDGSFDSSLNAFYGDKTSVYTVYTQPDGKLITAGHSLNDQKLFSREIVRLNSDGSVDPEWPTKTNEKIQSILPQPDGKLIIVGLFFLVNDIWEPAIARLNPDGSVDPALHAEVDGMIWGITQTRDKKLLVCGQFTHIDGVSTPYLARLILPENIEPPPPPPPPPVKTPQILSVRLNAGKFQCECAATATNGVYTLQFKATLGDADWTSLPDADGNGTSLILEDSDATSTKFYRVQAHQRL